MIKYRVVVFGSDWDVYTYAFHDFIRNEKIRFIPTYRPNGVLGQLQRIHFNPALNHKIKLPLKNIWNPYYTRGIDKNERICFIVFENWLRLESSIKLLPFLRYRFKNSITVCFLQDLVSRIIDHYTHKAIEIPYLKRHSNLIISYDNNDAFRYNIDGFHSVFSKYPVLPHQNRIPTDLYFLGRDKGRLDTLVSICKEANKRGFKCKFLILDVATEKQVKVDGIEYISTPISYRENIDNVVHSKFLIELLQPNAKSATFRTWEAITMNKHLMTCNTQLKELPVYDNKYISFFTDSNDFDWEFVEHNINETLNLDEYASKISPNRLLDHISEKMGILLEF